MNGVFAAMFFASLLSFLIFDPEGFLPALLAGGEKAVSLSLSLAAAYCVWLGFFGVMEQSGLTALFARAVRPAARRLFRSDDEKALSAACCSVSANLLSLPGAPTPLGIEATRRFLEGGNPFGAHMLFVLNAAGEVAVGAFLRGQIKYTQIAEIIESTLSQPLQGGTDSYAALAETDALARARAQTIVKEVIA